MLTNPDISSYSSTDSLVYQRAERVDSNTRDEKYHKEMATYCVRNGMNAKWSAYVSEYQENMAYFKGDQWRTTEDGDAFFKDSQNNARNRIKIVKNKWIPIISQYCGNANIMDITHKIEAADRKASDRRNAMLTQMMAITRAAQTIGGSFQEQAMSEFPIGRNEYETEQIFEQNYSDEIIRLVNLLGAYVLKNNEIMKHKSQIALDMSCGGLGGLMYKLHNGEFITVKPDMTKVFWDTTAIEQDLSDSEFMGYNEELTPTQIFEFYPDKTSDPKIKKQIEDWQKQRIIVIHVFWKDWETMEYGYVDDGFGYPMLARLNYREPEDEKPRYSETDLIDYSILSHYQKEIVMGGKKVKRVALDKIRYADIAISEDTTLKDRSINLESADVILDYGIMPYQDSEHHHYFSTKFPIKLCAWYLINGTPYTPLSNLRDPQRLINRNASIKDNLISSSLPASLNYNSYAVEDEETFVKNLYQGKPNAVDDRGQGINNTIGYFGGVMDRGIALLTNEIMADSQEMQQMIGVNESLLGGQQGDRKLVGVQVNEIQRASLIQELFYSGIERIYNQIFNAIIGPGKRFYCDNERELAVMIGDKVETFKLSRNIKMETFRAFTKRVVNSDTISQNNRAALTTFLQLGLINKQQFADLWIKAEDEDISKSIKMFADQLDQAQLMAQEDQANAQQMTQQQAMGEQARIESREDNIRNEERADKDKERINRLKIRELANKQNTR